MATQSNAGISDKFNICLYSMGIACRCTIAIRSGPSYYLWIYMGYNGGGPHLCTYAYRHFRLILYVYVAALYYVTMGAIAYLRANDVRSYSSYFHCSSVGLAL